MSQQLLKLLFGPILFGLCLLIGDANEPQLKMLGCLLWMLSWWITNALPVGVTALLPILVFPLLGILDLKSTSANYANPIIYLFFGGFILGLAIEKWNLHKRIALNIINLSGDKPSKIVLGTMLATALLSMWISNTATTVMMLPIGLSVAALLGTKIDDKKSASNFKVSLLLGIAFAANIGGITTLIGTPPNLVLAGLVDEYQLTSISFASWFLFALPLVTILFIIVFTINSMLMYPMRLKKIEGVKTMIKAEISGLGKMQAGEIRIAILMLAAAVLWITRTQLSKIPGLESLSDTAIAILAAISAFIIPSKPKKWNKPLLDWNDTKKLPWGILLLFGGGISIAKGMEQTEMVQLIGEWISKSELQHPFLLILLICALAVFLTEVMSNVALVAVFIPISFVIAQNFNIPELSLAIPLTIGASCAFMFPISTPPNAVVFSSGYIKMGQMARLGIILNILCILVITCYCYFFQDFFFG